MCRGWTQTDYRNKHYNKDEGTLDDRGRDEGTNFILRIKEQETRLTLQERDDDDDDEEVMLLMKNYFIQIFGCNIVFFSLQPEDGSTKGADTCYCKT